MGFGSWLRNLFANIAVLPAVAIFILIARTLILHIETNRLWIPPMIGGIGTTVAGIIGFGMLLLLPKVPQMVKEALQVKPFPYGTAIGEAIRTGMWPISYPLGIAKAGVPSRWIEGVRRRAERGKQPEERPIEED
jgi:hypothetical protein